MDGDFCLFQLIFVHFATIARLNQLQVMDEKNRLETAFKTIVRDAKILLSRETTFASLGGLFCKFCFCECGFNFNSKTDSNSRSEFNCFCAFGSCATAPNKTQDGSARARARA